MTRVGVALTAERVSKWYGAVSALTDVTLEVRPGEVTCLLGDNGAGKSTLIQILSGVLSPDKGTVKVDGNPVRLNGPKDALAMGIAAAYQDLALVPVMPIYRNFCLGAEPVIGKWPLRRFDTRRARELARDQLEHLGIALTDVGRPVGTLSGGQRQALAIARAVYAGARVLILDEPTAALGQTQAAIVLRAIEENKDRGVAVLLVTHNARHAYEAGDTFLILGHGRVAGVFRKAELSESELGEQMWSIPDVVAPRDVDLDG